MTSHFYGMWKITDPVTDELLESFLSCVSMNIRINSSCFAIMNDGDRVIYSLQELWQRWKDEPDQLDKELKYFADSSPVSESIEKIGKFVFEKLKQENL